MNQTIVAIATPHGTGGIGIVRMSGRDALEISANVFAAFAVEKNRGELRLKNGAKSTAETTKELLQSNPNKLIFGEVRCAEFCDRGYVVYFKAPASYTGEDVVEFQLHGGMRILDGVVRECIARGARPAERGEFTKRAFLSGKLGLSDAEGVIDMINAQSAGEIRAAFRLLSGEFGKKIAELESRLLELISALEASLDYPDEMEDEVLPQISPVSLSITAELEKLISSAREGRIVKDGLKIAIAGLPNVGKSSLLNAILKRERAIVAECAGTTRDVISETVEYKGLKFHFSDTAGIRSAGGEIEQMGVEFAKKEIEGADLVFFVTDASVEKKNDAEKEILKLIDKKEVFRVQNKADKAGENYGYINGAFRISAKYSQGIDELLDGAHKKFSSGGIASGEVVASERHLSALIRARDALISARNAEGLQSVDCVLIDLREAANRLGEITGTSVSEEIIEQIFSRFCVGK
jgi:tRNA modification GTPase